MIARKPALLVEDNKYCPGCGHGIINRLAAEVLEEMGRERDAIGVVAVGCACLMIDTFGVDWLQAQHGRACAVAAGIKRCRPENLVFTYQGDGDALSIGFAETMYAALRNENISVIFVNNGNFGMTGGQMAPTTLLGQRTTTSPYGRVEEGMGRPMDALKLLEATNAAYLARASVDSPSEIRRAKEFIRNAFAAQVNGEGFSFVEILSPCPTNWGLKPAAALLRIRDEVKSVYPVGEFIKGGRKL